MALPSTTLDSIVVVVAFELDAHLKTVLILVYAVINVWALFISAVLMSCYLLPSLCLSQQRTVSRVRELCISSLLSVMPLERSQFDLSAQEFRDGFTF